MSEQTARHYVVTLRAFGAWLAGGDDRRLVSSPFGTLSPITVTENRHARRELAAEELPRLLSTTLASGTTFRKLGGRERCVLYATACGTGFRAAGLAALTPECFDLSSGGPKVVLTVRSDKAKRGKKNHPIPIDLAESLGSFLPGRPAGVPVWPGTWAKHGNAAEMLRIDLESAGIPYVVEGPEGPEHADFHALRHSYITALGRSGVDLQVQQELAGHRSSKTTERYSHVRKAHLVAAVDRLPSIFPARTGEGTACQPEAG